jgi:hypothetical protein
LATNVTIERFDDKGSKLFLTGLSIFQIQKGVENEESLYIIDKKNWCRGGIVRVSLESKKMVVDTHVDHATYFWGYPYFHFLFAYCTIHLHIILN